MTIREVGKGRVIEAVGGRRTAWSRQGSIVTLSGSGVVPAPVNAALPVVSGVVRDGESLSCSTGSWTNSPDTYAYQWLLDGVPIIGASTASLVVTPSMIPAQISCEVTATNAGGSTMTTALAISSPLRAIFQLDASARIWTHQQGISTPVGDPVSAWVSVDGLHTLVQAQTTRQPLRRAGDVYLDGLDDCLYGNDQASLFDAAYTVAAGVSDLATTNEIRGLLCAAISGVSTSARRTHYWKLSMGTAALLSRQSYLAGGDGSAAQVDLTSLYALGATHRFNLSVRSDTPGSGVIQAHRLTAPLTLIDGQSWPPYTGGMDLLTIGAQRLSGAAPYYHFAGSLRYLIIIPRKLDDVELGIVRDALAAEGLT